MKDQTEMLIPKKAHIIHTYPYRTEQGLCNHTGHHNDHTYIRIEARGSNKTTQTYSENRFVLIDTKHRRQTTKARA